MRNRTIWAVILLILLIFFGTGFFVVRTVQQAAKPAKELTGSLATQVANLLHPTPTVLPDPVTIVREIRTLARLETIQYTIEKVITAESNQGPFGFLFGDRLLLVAHGIVIGGLDLAKIDPDDVWIDAQGRLMVRLPPPEIFLATLDNEKTYVYTRDTGMLTHGDVNLETTARKAAEAEMMEAALGDGILAQAQINAENYLDRWLRSLGYRDVIFLSESQTSISASTPTSQTAPSPTPNP